MNNQINSSHIKALQFREKLLKLCKEYECEISGSCGDNGDINVWFRNGGDYIMTDFYDRHSIYKENEDYELINVMEEIIKQAFDRDSSEMAGLNNIKVSCGIFTNNYWKAREKLEQIWNTLNEDERERFLVRKDSLEIRLKNGKRYMWIKPNNQSRGYRFSKAIIDKDVTLEELHNYILPICHACGRNDVEVF